MLNRSITPPFGKITSIDLIEPSVHHLDNGLPVFAVNAGTQEVLKIELIFNAGTANADKKLVASASSKLQTEGTTKRTAMELAEAVDFFGAHLQSEVTHDEASLSLYTLNKHVSNTIGTLAEVYSEPVFAAREVETYLLKSKQEMLVNEEKVSYLGAKRLALLFMEPTIRMVEVPIKAIMMRLTDKISLIFIQLSFRNESSTFWFLVNYPAQPSRALTNNLGKKND